MREIIYNSGDVFGTYTIIQKSLIKPYRSSQNFWVCKCKCGTTSIVPGQHLRKNPTYCWSCASGHRIISTKDKLLHYQWAQYRSGAAKRKLQFSLTYNKFVELIQQPCYYCGSYPNPINGVDRVDNSAGYVDDNSKPCCTICNRAKREMPESVFVNWISALRKPSYFHPITIERIRTWSHA